MVKWMRIGLVSLFCALWASNLSVCCQKIKIHNTPGWLKATVLSLYLLAHKFWLELKWRLESSSNAIQQLFYRNPKLCTVAPLGKMSCACWNEICHRASRRTLRNRAAVSRNDLKGQIWARRRWLHTPHIAPCIMQCQHSLYRVN